MIRTIEDKDKLYALVSDGAEEPKKGTSEWFGKSYEQLQGSRMHYEAGKSFKTHKHKLNPRIVNRTQECFIVVSGKIQIDIFVKEKISGKLEYNLEVQSVKGLEVIKHLGTLTASAGEAIYVYDGFHKLTILEDAVFYETKVGSFTTVEDDKEFLPEVD